MRLLVTSRGGFIGSHACKALARAGHDVEREAVAEVTGRAAAVIEAPRRPGDPRCLYAAADLARQLLGWRPRFRTIEPTVRTAAIWLTRDTEMLAA